MLRESESGVAGHRHVPIDIDRLCASASGRARARPAAAVCGVPCPGLSLSLLRPELSLLSIPILKRIFWGKPAGSRSASTPLPRTV